MIDKKTFWIGILTLVAVMLLAVHALQPGNLMPVAHAQESVDSRDYQMATAESAQGGEVLYVLDKRSGLLALLQWNAGARKPEVTDMKPIQNAFGR